MARSVGYGLSVPLTEQEERVKLSLSTRVVEPPGRKDRALMGIEQLSALARDAGYAALCMRCSQVGINSDPETLHRVKVALADNGLDVSMVTGDLDIPVNTDRAQMALRNITPHLDLAEALGTDLIRIAMKAWTDVPWARRAADEAAERGIRLAHQSHTCTLFETVGMSLEVLREAGRDNFGIIYEPSNLVTCGQGYGVEVLRAFRPHLFNVYLQNMWLHSAGGSTIETWVNGPVTFDLVPFGDPRGVDFFPILEALRKMDYEGYVTVHHNVADGLDVETGTREFADYLRSGGHVG